MPVQNRKKGYISTKKILTSAEVKKYYYFTFELPGFVVLREYHFFSVSNMHVCKTSKF